jgi:hypothetical protein
MYLACQGCSRRRKGPLTEPTATAHAATEAICTYDVSSTSTLFAERTRIHRALQIIASADFRS